MIDHTILLVDDDADNRSVVSTLLRHYGFEVIECADGESAVALATLHRPDVVLMDVSLPGIDGWTATERLKGDDATSGIPVIALTGSAFPADRARARALGFAGYLAKPCPPAELLREVRRVAG